MVKPGDARTRRHVLQKMDIVQTDRVYFADVCFTVYWRVDFNDARGQRSVQRLRMSQRRDGFPKYGGSLHKIMRALALTGANERNHNKSLYRCVGECAHSPTQSLGVHRIHINIAIVIIRLQSF
ncbi:Uncharacterised protein [Salmonella enterica subsp. enterica]|nr:Uncharacterised protein [Salmonella enterica subsp. enterica]